MADDAGTEQEKTGGLTEALPKDALTGAGQRRLGPLVQRTRRGRRARDGWRKAISTTAGTVPIGASWGRAGGAPSTGLTTFGDEEGAVVSFADKVRNKAQELRGRIKRNTGEVTGDRRLQAEGGADEVKSKVKRAWEKVKDVFRGRGTRRRKY
jgi:uncharacterized protein YjbJ (UPF0337 family)